MNFVGMFFQCPTWKKKTSYPRQLFGGLPEILSCFLKCRGEGWTVQSQQPGVFFGPFSEQQTQPFSRLFLNSNSRGRFSLYVGFVMCLDCLHCPRGFKERLCWLMVWFFFAVYGWENYPEIYCYSRISICKMNGCTSLVIGFSIHFDG